MLSLVETGELSAGHARALIPIENEKAQLEAAREVVKKSLSVRKTERMAARLCRPEPEKKPEESELRVDYAAELEEELGRLLGRRVHLVESRSGGRIELEFYSAEDREALIDQLRELKTQHFSL